MKQYWQRLALKVDALSLRERAIVFAMVALILIVLINTALLDPQFSRQTQLSQRMKQDQAQIAAIQAEVQMKVKQQEIDPDAANRARLQGLRQQAAQMQSAMRDMQKGLVPSDKMASLVGDIVKQNGKLRLISLKTLPVAGLSESSAGEPNPVTEKIAVAPAAGSAARDGRPEESIYKHGVEITMQGGYLDMMAYMAKLESMPWQLFWGKAKLIVDEYPKATLTLTLYTLSLDKKWLNI